MRPRTTLTTSILAGYLNLWLNVMEARVFQTWSQYDSEISAARCHPTSEMQTQLFGANNEAAALPIGQERQWSIKVKILY